MPLGIVSDKDFDTELTRVKDDKPPVPTKPEAIVNDIPRGRGTGNVEVPNALRNVIGAESEINGRQSALELAESFGISPSSVSAYSKGATSTATIDERPNLPVVNNIKTGTQKIAMSKLRRALHHITNEKLEFAKPTDLSVIARNMSAIVKDLEPETPKGEGVEKDNKPMFIFYAPQFRDERHYDVVHAKE